MAPNISVRRGMMPRRELRLIVMFLCLKKAVPADENDIQYEGFLESFAAFHDYGMVTVLR